MPIACPWLLFKVERLFVDVLAWEKVEDLFSRLVRCAKGRRVRGSCGLMPGLML